MTIIARKDFEPNTLAGARRLRQGERRHRHLRQRRHRRRLAPVRHAVHGRDRHPARHRALPGHRPGDDRPDGRPGRLHVRPDDQHHRPDPGRRGQGLRCDLARAAAQPARPADHRRGRPARRQHRRLARALRPRRHPARGAGQADGGAAGAPLQDPKSSSDSPSSAPRRHREEATPARRSRKPRRPDRDLERPADRRPRGRQGAVGRRCQQRAASRTSSPAWSSSASALAFGYAASGYQIGTAVRMGPGYFPLLLAGALGARWASPS